MTRADDRSTAPSLTLSGLLGAWALARRVSFRRGGGSARVRGTVTVTDHGGGVALYEESGRLELDGRAYRAVRRYWMRMEGARCLALYFADDGRRFDPATARPFVRLETAADGALVGTHRCGADRYDGAYRARGAASIAITWRVTGPRKEGTIRSRLVRARSRAGNAATA